MDYKDYSAGATEEHFWFKGKSDLIEVLLQKASRGKKCKILDIGAGTGEDLKVITKFGDVFVIDIEKKAIDLISQDLVAEKQVADVLDIPYDDNSFDIVVCFDVLEHVEDDAKAVAEILRVLKPGGSFVFTVPAFNCIYSEHDRKLHHFRRYNKKSISLLLKDFTRETLGYWFFFLFLPAVFIRWMSRDISTNDSFFRILHPLFYKILSLENWLIRKGTKFPFGLSIYGIVVKENGKIKNHKEGSI